MPIELQEVVFHQQIFAANEIFAIFARNADGTVTLFNPLFTDFTISHDASTELTTAKAASPFALQANTDYWRVLSSPGGFVAWDWTVSTSYTSHGGVSMPAGRGCRCVGWDTVGVRLHRDGELSRWTLRLLTGYAQRFRRH